MKKAIITGATGLIGSHLVVELLRSGDYSITAMVRSEQSKSKLREILARHSMSDQAIHYTVVNTENYDELRVAIEGFDTVFHCAAIVSFDGSSAEQIVANNVELTAYVVNSCLASQSNPLLVHISSIAALGTAPYPELTTENTPFTGIATASAYSRSKFLSENEVWRGVTQGLRSVIVCPSVVMGVGASGSEGLQPVFRMASRGIPFYTQGVVGYVDVVDVARAMRLLAADETTYGKKYIVSGENLSYKELISALNRAFGKPLPHINVPKWLLKIAVATLGVIQRKPLLTKEMISFLTEKTAYDGTLLTRTLSMEYATIEQTAKRIADESTK